jgi:molybdopterin molybdotransferase
MAPETGVEMTEFETRSPDWLSLTDALDRVLAAAEPLATEEVELPEASGRALAQDVFAAATLPPWDNSAMDGYAVRHGDLLDASERNPVSLRVLGEIKAGDLAGRALGPGEAMRIMTGAPMPTGADTVVRVEDTDAEEVPGTVRVRHSPGRGDDIRPGGQDMLEGERLLTPGTTVGPGQIGLLAAAGARRVLVHRRPTVAILSNGDEIAPQDAFHRVLAGKAVPETNGPTLAAAVKTLGGVPLPLGIAEDRRESILQKVLEARDRRVDVLVTSGGASMGEYDLFKRVLDELGFELDFWRVKMRPGTPFSFGTLPSVGEGGSGPIRVFGLPGNPASSFVTFQLFCRPFLLRLAGHRRIHRQVIRARAREEFRSPEHLTHFFRVRLDGDPALPEATMTGPQTSGLVKGQALAQGLAVVPEGVQIVGPGEPLRVILLDEYGHPSDHPAFWET